MEIKLSPAFFDLHQKLLWEKLEEAKKMKEKAKYHLQKFSETNDMNELLKCSYLKEKANRTLNELLEQACYGLKTLISQNTIEG